jgi:hypothetical protein
MSVALLGTAFFAPPPRAIGGFHVSTTVIVIIVIVALLGALAILGWRSPDRSPGADSKAQRDRVED